jgi:hypothetical protein
MLQNCSRKTGRKDIGVDWKIILKHLGESRCEEETSIRLTQDREHGGFLWTR